MKCPNCQNPLEKTTYKNITIDKCRACEGMWFDATEIDALEDTVFDDDAFKNTMITNVRDSDRLCPICNAIMKKFNYRWEDELVIEYCPKNHGFWLDRGEEMKVVNIMTQQANDENRTLELEDSWKKHLNRMQSPTFLSKIIDFIEHP